MPAIELVITLQGEHNKNKKKINVYFTNENWNILENFVHEVDKVRATRFAQEGQGGSINIRLNSQKGLSSKAKLVDDEAFSTLLLKLRPILLNNEDTYFFKVWNILCEQLHTHQVFLDALKEIRQLFQLDRMTKISKFITQDHTPSSPNDVMDWLNSYAYHRDEEKKVRIEKKLGLFGADQNGAPVIVFAITEMSNAIFQLSDFIENLLESRKGEFPILCPNKYL